MLGQLVQQQVLRSRNYADVVSSGFGRSFLPGLRSGPANYLSDPGHIASVSFLIFN
jgi:hypothetical protein